MLSVVALGCKARSGDSLAKQTQVVDAEHGKINDSTLPAGMRFIPLEYLGVEMAETEVTRAQWKAMMASYPEDPLDLCANQHNETKVGDTHPVTCVTWRQANLFAREMDKRKDGYSYRLPTSDEWTDAAGDIEGETYGWCDDHGLREVAHRKVYNGLFDMVGNAWEWTASLHGESKEIRTKRGGTSNNRSQHLCRASDSSWGRPDEPEIDTGFRLVRKRID